MIVKATPENLDQEIVEQLKDWANGDLRRAVNEAVKETAETAAKMLRQGDPYQERTGKYTKDWDSKLRKGKYTSEVMTEQYSVYNKKHFRLTHLLEKGHQSRNGGRVKAYEHIKPTYDVVEQLAISNIGKRVREISK